MSESNYNWVCFRCRTPARKPKSTKDIVNCRICGQPCTCIDYKTAVPTKGDVKAWNRLETETKDSTLSATDQKRMHIDAQITLIQAQITRLEDLEQNDGRDKLIRNLKKQLSELNDMK